MKIVLVFVSSLDGKITKWDDPEVRSWSSISDQEYYREVWKNSKLIVMGSNTYNVSGINASHNRLIVVMTQDPSRYEKLRIMNHLEFMDRSPSELVSRFKEEGYDQMTVVGGPLLAVSFLKDNLIDELWLTIEPKLFGRGNSLLPDQKLDINLKLISCERINDRGTLITKYSVLK